MGKNGNNNGKYNGFDDSNEEDEKIIRFPTLAERDRAARIEREAEARWRKEYKKNNAEPFFKFGNIPLFTKYSVAIIVIIHVIMALVLPADLRLKSIYTFGFIPAIYTGSAQWQWSAIIAPLSHAFIHGSWMHLGVNAFMGLALGTFFERLYGARSTAIFLILCTLAGALATLIIAPFSDAPIIGASGGISGLFGALILFTLAQSQYTNPLAAHMKKFTRRGPWPVLIFWGAFMVLPGLIFGGLAWQAHLGGYIAGVALMMGIQRGKIKF